MTKRTKLIFFAVLFAVAFVLITGFAGAAGVAIYNHDGPGWYVAFVICCALPGVLVVLAVRKRRGQFHQSN